MTRDGHAVSQFAVSFYAPDSEQAGMLARAQEIENLERQQRAQALIADEARSASCGRRRRTPTPSQRLVSRPAAKPARPRPAPTSCRCNCCSLTQQAEATDTPPRPSCKHELAEIDAQLEGLAERRAVGEGRFEELDLQLGQAQERHAELEDAVIAGRAHGWPTPASSCARWSARRRRRSFQARALAARRDELQRAIATAKAADRRPTPRPASSCSWSSAASTMPPPRPACRTALAREARAASRCWPPPAASTTT